MSDGLDKLRGEINRIDSEIIERLNDRARISCEIGKTKEGTGAAYYSPARENELMQHWKSLNKGPLSDEALQSIFREILSVSRALQKDLNIAFLGPEATYTQQAALKNFGASASYTALRSIPDVFDAVERGEADYGVIPIENSNEGSVIHSLDMFVDSDLQIVNEVLMPIEHCLLSNSSLSEISSVYSKDQAIGQCRDWLRRNLPSASLVHSSSTANAVDKAKSEKGVAVIASALASEHYGVNIVEKGIQDKANNTTRFLVIGKNAPPPPNDPSSCKTSILITINHEPGALQTALKPFGSRDINLSRIESRPSRRKAWDYVFFIDFAGHWDEPHIQEAMSELNKVCPLLKCLGSYPNAVL